jgi:hypothetical protein
MSHLSCQFLKIKPFLIYFIDRELCGISEINRPYNSYRQQRTAIDI